LYARLLPSLKFTVIVEATVVLAIAFGSASVGAAMPVNVAVVKAAVGAGAVAGVAALLSLPPHAVASSEAVAAPPSGSIGAPARILRALRRERSSRCAMGGFKSLIVGCVPAMKVPASGHCGLMRRLTRYFRK
jgi:hypothetical protein